MKQTINFSEFCDTFRSMDRNNNFTYAGKKALFDYLEEYEDDTGHDIELDIIALCCEYTEYENLTELRENYPDIESIDDLADETTVIEINDESFIIANF